MITVLLIDGKTVSFITQQYQVGLYLAVYEENNPIPDQCGLDEHNETKYHNRLRKMAEKNGYFFIKEKSTIIPEKVKRIKNIKEN